MIYYYKIAVIHGFSLFRKRTHVAIAGGNNNLSECIIRIYQRVIITFLIPHTYCPCPTDHCNKRLLRFVKIACNLICYARVYTSSNYSTPPTAQVNRII